MGGKGPGGVLAYDAFFRRVSDDILGHGIISRRTIKSEFSSIIVLSDWFV